jgi:hypothetical protein
MPKIAKTKQNTTISKLIELLKLCEGIRELTRVQYEEIQYGTKSGQKTLAFAVWSMTKEIEKEVEQLSQHLFPKQNRQDEIKKQLESEGFTPDPNFFGVLR